MKTKDYSNTSIQVGAKTKYKCPVCFSNDLICNESNVKLVEYNNHNQKLLMEDETEPEWYKYGFHGVLACSNPSCREKIVFSGKASIDFFYARVSEDDYEEHEVKLLKIEYIERSPHIIEVMPEYPNEIKNALLNSFQMFWFDMNSCANKIRVVVELIMDNFSITKQTKSGRILPLDQRILEFEKLHPHLKNQLMAIKWIGNYGSHTDSIERQDLIDGYTILDFALKKLFDNKANEVELLAKILDACHNQGHIMTEEITGRNESEYSCEACGIKYKVDYSG